MEAEKERKMKTEPKLTWVTRDENRVLVRSEADLLVICVGLEPLCYRGYLLRSGIVSSFIHATSNKPGFALRRLK